MANTDITRTGEFAQKKESCVLALYIDKEVGEVFTAAGNYLVANLPPEAVITNAFVSTDVVSDAGAVTVGTTEGGTEILSAGDTTALGKTGTFTGQSLTGSGTPVFMTVAAAMTAGRFTVIVEYIEYRKHTGEYTQITN